MTKPRMESNRRRTARQPLRKVLGYTSEEVIPGVKVLRERLECGHLQSPRHDMIGETNAARRRCNQCPPRLTPGERDDR